MHDVLSEEHQICCGSSRLWWEATFQIWSKSHQPFLRYERPKFQGFFFFFSHKHKNCFNSETQASIGLKFGKLVWRPNSYEHKHQILWRSGLAVISDYSRKQELICWLAYRVNRWLDRPENWYVARFNIRGVLFDGYKRQQRYEARPNLGKTCTINFRVIEIHAGVPASIRQTTRKNQLKIAVIIHCPL